jgi:hypothetical protein
LLLQKLLSYTPVNVALSAIVDMSDKLPLGIQYLVCVASQTERAVQHNKTNVLQCPSSAKGALLLERRVRGTFRDQARRGYSSVPPRPLMTSCLRPGHKARVPITVAARTKARTVFAHSNTWIVGSNPAEGMDVSVRFFCVQVEALGRAHPPSSTDCV